MILYMLIISLLFIHSDTKRSLSDHIGEESQKYLRSNVAHLLALTIDSIIGLNGGLKQLLALSTSPRLTASKVQVYTEIQKCGHY